MSGKMTEDSLKELVNQVFLLIDVNQNGVLEEDEVRNFFKQMIAKH
jgi:Ca2+-binding EF-hand superfamily protein